MKYKVKLETCIEADTREHAWNIARLNISLHYSELVDVVAVGMEPVDNEWLAVNTECPNLFKREA